MYAVIKTGGKQYRVTSGEKIKVEQIPAAVGSQITLDHVLLVADGEKVSIGAPLVTGATVQATIVAHGRADKVHIFKMRRRKRGHRQPLSLIKVVEILTDGRKADHAALAAEVEKSKPRARN